MGKITDLLSIGTELSTVLAQRCGAKTLENSKKVLLDIDGSKPIYKKMQSVFCRNAKEPKVALEYNITEQSKNVQMQFFDGKTPLSSGSLTQHNSGNLNFSVNITDRTGVKQASAHGSYNPNVPLFDWDNCGETLERRFGYTNGRIDSSGFDISASVKNSCVLNLLNDIKSFFKNDYKSLTT